MATESGMVFLSIDREGDPGNYLGSENGQKITSSRDHEVEMSDRDQPQQNAPNWLVAMYSNIPDLIGLSGVKYVCRPREKRTRRITWAGSGLNVANVTSILTASGVCFQLNADPDPTKVLKTKVAGKNKKNIRVEYYYGSVSRFAAGFDLYLLPQDETESNNAVVGLNINPGTLSSIGITSKRSNYLRPPYGVCGKHELKYFDTYSRTKCQLECQTDLVLEKCRCKPPFMPGQFPVCDPLTYEKCGYPAIENVQRRLNECDCPVNCETLAYSYLLSSSKFPALFWADILVDKGIVKHSGQGRVDRTFLEDNVCAIDMYFTSMELTTIKQQAAYTPLALLSK
ncbi:acid-sensing ion channel 1-like [Diadema antillarum]|uniref:acid-sensing ion channel 1-like n=1 Tax=Diadema antillarum TaxID=105358 RepID=UPI003A8AFCE7